MIASAESLTHAAVYSMDAEVRAVVHGHAHELWCDLVERGPSTSADVTYGTPEMAREVQRLFRETDVRATKLFAMAGHADGIVAFGQDFRQALAKMSNVRRDPNLNSHPEIKMGIASVTNARNVDSADRVLDPKNHSVKCLRKWSPNNRSDNARRQRRERGCVGRGACRPAAQAIKSSGVSPTQKQFSPKRAA